MSENDIVEIFIDSLAEHAGLRRLADFRNEDSRGKQRTGGDARGDALSAFDKEDFRQHIRQTLNDPETNYFIDQSNDRMVFFNEKSENRAVVIFNPEKNADGHFGTAVRANVRNNKYFDKELSKSEVNMGAAPEIRSVSDGGWIDNLEGYRTQLENAPERVLGKGDLRTDYARAGDDIKTQPLQSLDYSAPNSPKMSSPLKRSFNVISEAAGPILKTTGMVILGAIPIVGILPNTVEAAELKDKLATAIDNGEISSEAVTEYNLIMTGHIAQGADPTVVLGEAGVQQSFNDWADRYDVQGDLRESLQPSSLALMLKDGGTYIADNIERLPSATVDVGLFAGQTAVVAGEIGVDALDNAYDYMSGNTEVTQGVYNSLPSVDLQEVTARNLTGDHAVFNERDDIHDLLQSKARAEYFEGKMEAEEDPAKQAYFGDRLQDAKDGFEVSVEAMDEDQLNDVQDYLVTYNQYVEGSAAENAVTPTQDIPVVPEVFGSPSVETTNRIGI